MTGLAKDVVCHNDEELVKISHDLMAYCSKGLKDLRESHGESIPSELQAHVDLYKNTIATCAEFLQRTGNWDGIV